MARLVAALAGLSLAAACTAAEESTGEPIEPAELVSRIAAGQAPVVLDVRTPEEYANGHIPGAVNIPHDELAEALPSLGLDRSEEIVVHCESGRRAGMAEELLRESGHTQVRDLRGHMRAWREAGHPLE